MGISLDKVTDLQASNNPFLNRQFWLRFVVYLSIFLLSADLVYKTVYGITYVNRQDCILYANLSRPLFLFYEYFIELFLVVIVGVFIAAILEKHFSRMSKFIPRNPVTAFLYASVIPVCSCSAVPLIKAMNHKIPFRTIITFVVAAPLLNPYIIMLSITVLGLQYAILRIVCSFVLAIATGYAVELFYQRTSDKKIGLLEGCNTGGNCRVRQNDVYESGYLIFKRILPFLLLAGAMGLAIEILAPGNLLRYFDLSSNFIGTALVILIGVPVYFCNGADVLFLQPLINHSQLPMGTAMAFSLTSTSVCVTSLVLLVKYIGKKLTFILLSCVVLMTFILSFVIQLISKF
ncbi:MAG: hypothetical protein GY839_00820 [candidate division Zixibacteria bacterium]|nr:hypothetical protein [candidate division Zixibacteria bacterium]